MSASRDEWASATDLAEYAYCPRAWHYRTTDPGGPRTIESRRASSEGERYHRATLAAEERHERHAAAYGAAVAVALLLVIGGLLWIFH